MVKHLPAMRETWVWSLGWEDPMWKEMATHSSTLVWKIPCTEERGRLQFMGLQRVGHDWAISIHIRYPLEDKKLHPNGPAKTVDWTLQHAIHWSAANLGEKNNVSLTFSFSPLDHRRKMKLFSKHKWKYSRLCIFQSILGCPMGSITHDRYTEPTEKSRDCPQLTHKLLYENCHSSINGSGLSLP